jgi:hypothetical protein
MSLRNERVLIFLLIAILALLAIIFAGGLYLIHLDHLASLRREANAAATPSATPIAPPVAAPSPFLPAATPAPSPKNLAETGVYYLLERISVVDDAGVKGMAPGTKVVLLQRSDDTWKVTDGENDFDVKPAQLTNDLDEVSALEKRLRINRRK